MFINREQAMIHSSCWPAKTSGQLVPKLANAKKIVDGAKLLYRHCLVAVLSASSCSSIYRNGRRVDKVLAADMGSDIIFFNKIEEQQN